MTDPEDLLPAVLAAPDDDLPRLVYADALEEAGDVARAEFIRVQIELARNPGRQDLVAREAALMAVYGEKWLAPLRKKGEALESKSTHGKFRRGFVEVVWMPAAAFVQWGERLLSQVPVRELRVVKMTVRDFDDFLLCPLLDRIRGLDLSDRKLGDDRLFLLLLREMTVLRILRLRACNLTDRSTQFLLTANPKSRNKYKELDLSLNAISRPALAALRYHFGTDVVRFDPPTDSIPARPGR